MKHFLLWRQHAFPITWSQVFAREAPLHLEVGFGDGRFTVRRALEHPDQSFVALEISTVSISRVLNKLKKSDIQNVRVLKLGAQFAVRHLFAPASLDSITVNFPDPWPKDKHVHHRLLQRRFFELASNRLKIGGTIALATDHPEYLAFAQQEALVSGVFELKGDTPPPAVFETKYALKWKLQGKPLFYQVFLNRGSSFNFPFIERSDMPHALLRGQLPQQITFTKQVVPYAEGHVIVHEVLKSLAAEDQLEEGRWLFRVTIDEPDLKQQVLIVVKRRQDDEYIVRFEPFGDPVLTATARGAVHAVTEWLLTLPGIHLKARNY